MISPPSPPSPKKVPIFQIKEVLGIGAYGSVYKGVLNGREYAFKTCSLDSPLQASSIKIESAILHHLNTSSMGNPPYIVKGRCLFSNSKSKRWYLALELLGIDLHRYCKIQKTGLSLQKLQRFTKQLAHALAFLKNATVIHRDIKPGNILLSPDAESVKITDFGLACCTEPSYPNPTHIVQTSIYRSPEVILELPQTAAIDIWSLGAVICFCYTSKAFFFTFPQSHKSAPVKPIDEENKELALSHLLRLGAPYPKELLEQGTDNGRETIANAYEIKYKFDDTLETVITKTANNKGDEQTKITSLLNLLRGVFEYLPEKRLTAEEISNHPFLSDETIIPNQILTTGDDSLTTPPLNPNKRLRAEEAIPRAKFNA